MTVMPVIKTCKHAHASVPHEPLQTTDKGREQVVPNTLNASIPPSCQGIQATCNASWPVHAWM